jgi:hypothetical protein
MWYETTRSAQAAGEAASPCCAAREGGPGAVRRRPPGPRVGEFGLSLVADISAPRVAGATAQAHAGAAGPVVRSPEGEVGTAAVEGRPPGRPHDRSLDSGSRRRIDPSRVRHSVSPGARVEAADRTGLELPKAGAARRGAGRRGHRPVDPGRLAPDKKTPLDVAPISSSSMRAAFCSSPTCAARGRPEGRLPTCVIGTATTASRSAAGWRCRPSGVAWPSISGVGPARSLASTCGRSCATCSGICAARWISSGIADPSTAAARSRRFCDATRGCTSTTSPRTRPSSTRRSMCGLRLTKPSPTAPLMISTNSVTASVLPSADFGAPRTSSGPASMLRTCRGCGELSIT